VVVKQMTIDLHMSIMHFQLKH